MTSAADVIQRSDVVIQRSDLCVKPSAPARAFLCRNLATSEPDSSSGAANRPIVSPCFSKANQKKPSMTHQPCSKRKVWQVSPRRNTSASKCQCVSAAEHLVAQ